MKIWLTLLSFLIATLSYQVSFGFQDPVPPTNSPGPPDPEYSPQGIYQGPIALPDIVRYRQLPMRMHLDPVIPFPAQYRVLDDRLVPLWTRMLKEATDKEIQEVAAHSLSRVAEMELMDIQSAGPVLTSVVTSTKDVSIRYACAKALASGNIKTAGRELVKLAAEGTDTQRLMIEPALSRWKLAEAAELWRPRLSDPQVSGISFRLAAEGLASLNDAASVATLLAVVDDRTVDFNKRTAAGRAAAIIDPDKATAAAVPLMTQDVPERLLALTLLNNATPDAITKAASLCTDPSDAVASVAWSQTFQWKPEVLTQHLTTGVKHNDAVVRITVAKVIRLLPDVERIRQLHTLVSDVHIEVRNVARQMLVAVATEHAELKDQIISQAGDMLKPDSTNWQGIEQSLVLLGQLHATQFSQPCMDLLDHPRDEVEVSAAWLIQLSPDMAIYDQVRTSIEKTEKSFNDNPLTTEGEGLRMAMLLQYAGLVRMKELQPLMEKQFAKSVPGNVEKRASALWALGLLYEKNPMPELVAKFESRVQDRSAIPPEMLEVRRMSVMALGLMRSKSSSKVVREAYEVDSEDTYIPGTARWVLPLLGEPLPEDFTPFRMMIGGWRLNPPTN